MNLSVYQDLQFADPEAFADFTLSLQLNHQAIAQKLGALNVVYPTYPLADVDGSKKDWQQSLQSELESIYRALDFSGLPDLSGSDLEKEQDFETFVQLLVFSEQRVNAVLGIT